MTVRVTHGKRYGITRAHCQNIATKTTCGPRSRHDIRTTGGHIDAYLFADTDGALGSAGYGGSALAIETVEMTIWPTAHAILVEIEEEITGDIFAVAGAIQIHLADIVLPREYGVDERISGAASAISRE